MKKVIFFALAFSLLSPTSHAEKQENLILPIPDSETPLPISKYFVDDLLNKIASACSTQDKQALFAQFSKRIKADFFQKNDINENNVFPKLSYICNNIAHIQKEWDDPQKTPFFGIKQMRDKERTRLCTYNKNETIADCSNSIRVAIENNMLKLDER